MTLDKVIDFLNRRTKLVLFIVLVLGVVISIFPLYRLSYRLIEKTALHDARVYANALKEFRTLYASEVVSKLEGHGIEVTHDYKNREKAIPLPATLSMLLGNRLTQQHKGGSASLYSAYPFPWNKTGGLQDEFSKKAWESLNRQPDQDIYQFETIDGHKRLRYAIADVMRPACVNCHNNHPQSPKRGWKVGDVRGVLEVRRPLDIVVSQTQAEVLMAMGLNLSLTLLGISVLALVIGRLRNTSARLSLSLVEQQEAGAALQTAHTALQETVNERTKALSTVKIEIAERKKQEAVRRTSDERYRSIFNASHDAIFLIDPKRDEILEVNAVACKMLGFTREELLALHISDIHPNEMEALETFSRSVLEKGGGLIQDLSCRTKAGHFVPAEISAAVIEIDQRRCIMSVVRNITDRKQLEAGARLASSVFNSAAEAIMVTDADKNIISVNPAFTEITGYTSNEVMGENPRILKSNRHDASFYKKMSEVLDRTGRWEGEIWDRKKSGEIYPKWLSISAIQNEHGDLVQFIALFSDITQRKEDEKELHYRAYYDPLTRLPNRTLAFERLSQTIVMGSRYEKKAALFFVDLDHFKEVNDTLGHIVGDEILTMAADRLLSSVRETDTVARTGGDEFVIIFPQIKNRQEIKVVADKIIRNMSRAFHLEKRDLFLGASIGIAIIPDDGKEPTALLKNADMAMYKAKASGRNNYQFFSRKMEKKDKDRTLLAWDLRQAIDNQELVLYYQPIVDLKSLKTVSLEALLRWNHPHRGLVPPDQFIPLAENSDLITQIGKWVLITACLQMKKWRDDFELETDISVNLSCRDFLHSDVLLSISDALEKSGLPAEALIIEVTEGIMLDPNEEALKKLQSIKDLGVRLSIDDFGTGYSSLSYLARYRMDLLKIDKSFIQGANSDPKKKPLVEAIVRMGQSMGLEIIAEGVETFEDLSYLRELGCDKVQGFYFSKPLSVEAYEAVLKNRRQN